jgi:hypothetical protein
MPLRQCHINFAFLKLLIIKLPVSKTHIPVIFQTTSFGLSLFTLYILKKTRNRPDYYSLFSKYTAQKSSRPKTSILKDHGYRCYTKGLNNPR